MSFRSCLYVGSVTHRRFRPRAHSLRYRVFWMLIDLDEIETLASKLRLFSHNRPNVFSLRDADYGDGSGRPLRQQVDAHLKAAGIETGGAIRLLTMPRVLGYGFNPISVWFCHGRDGEIAAMLYEVHNTFRQRHSYLIPVEPEAQADRVIRQQCDKAFYVSPFIEMAMHYAFKVTAPAETISVTVSGGDEMGPLIVASLAGERRPLGDLALLRLFFTHPLLTAKVIGAIWWEAMRMMLKGYRPIRRPEPPADPVTIVPTGGS